MNIFSISCILVLIFPTVMALFLFLKKEKRKGAILWGWVCLLVGVWGFAGYKFSTVRSKEISYFWWQIAYIAAILNPVIYYHFVYVYLELKKRYYKYILLFAYVLGAIFIIFDLFFKELFLGNLGFVFNQFYWIHPGIRTLPFWFFYIGFWWLLLGYSFLLLFKAYKCFNSIERTKLKYIMLGSGMGWIGGALCYLPAFHIDIYPYSNFLLAFYPFIIAYAIIKHRLMDIKVAVTRVGMFLVVYPLILGLPFYIGFQTKSWVLAASFAAFFGSLGPFIYRLFRRKAESLILAQQRRYQYILLQAARGMVREHDLTRLLKLIVYMLKRVVKVKFAVMFFYDKESKTYLLKTARGNKIDFPSVIFDEDFFLISYIKKISSPFIFEEMPFDMQKKLQEQFGISFSLIIPSIVKEEVLAFLVLGEKLDKSAYSDDDINVFTILSRQAALAIENCMFLEEFKEIQLQLFQAEKLASIGGIADGVAHQIKNRLNQFSLASGELKLAVYDFKENNAQIAKDEKGKEFFKYLMEIADSLTSNVKRTDDIVRGILNFARTTEKDTFFGDFSFEETVNSCLEVLRIKHSALTLPIQINFNSVRMIWGIRAQLSEVIYNLLDNAYEATQMFAERLSDEEKQKYRPRIILEAEEKKDSYLITISDNGIGVKEEEKQKIFAPFFTTKSSYKSGSGIGMYVAKRIVEENHKGKIWFESEYLKGGQFFIKLPKPKDSPSSPPPFIIEDNADGTK